MSVLRPPISRQVTSFSAVTVGVLAFFVTLGALFTSESGFESHAEAAAVALWWIAYAAVKSACIYDHKPNS